MADLGGAIEKLKQMMATEEGQANIQNIVANFGGGGNIDTSNLGSMLGNFAAQNSENTDDSMNSSDDSGGGFDPDMMMKMQKMMSMMGGGSSGAGNNRHATMLNSLKPYLSDDRRGKLDMAAKMMSLAKFAPLMKEL